MKLQKLIIPAILLLSSQACALSAKQFSDDNFFAKSMINNIKDKDNIKLIDIHNLMKIMYAYDLWDEFDTLAPLKSAEGNDEKLIKVAKNLFGDDNDENAKPDGRSSSKSVISSNSKPRSEPKSKPGVYDEMWDVTPDTFKSVLNINPSELLSYETELTDDQKTGTYYSWGKVPWAFDRKSITKKGGDGYKVHGKCGHIYHHHIDENNAIAVYQVAYNYMKESENFTKYDNQHIEYLAALTMLISIRETGAMADLILISPAKAKNITQIKDDTYNWLIEKYNLKGMEDKKPSTYVKMTTEYLRFLGVHYTNGKWNMGVLLTSYNAGQGRVKKSGKNGIRRMAEPRCYLTSAEKNSKLINDKLDGKLSDLQVLRTDVAQR